MRFCNPVSGSWKAWCSSSARLRPSDPQIAWFLSSFISDVRSVSLDPVLMRQNWLRAYDFVTDRGALVLNAHARATNPFAEIGDRTVSVQVTSVVRVSERSFQVKWTEHAFRRGNPADSGRWTAILTVTMRPPRSADILRKNPLGLYVDAVDWSQELDPATSAGSLAQAPAGCPTPQPAPDPTPPGTATPPTVQHQPEIAR